MADDKKKTGKVRSERFYEENPEEQFTVIKKGDSKDEEKPKK